jgi:hypothetical protein
VLIELPKVRRSPPLGLGIAGTQVLCDALTDIGRDLDRLNHAAQQFG